ncbi:MAG: hypothetical protein IKG03_07050 [Clostridiales bacterium]|nr:hypothetical protein [Clostridiales bacterium]
MKRILCALMIMVLTLCLSGCFQPLDKDGMVYEEPPSIEVLNITNEDVFDTGYYGMQFKYDDREPTYAEKITVTVYFNRRTDLDTDWAVYVSDYELPVLNESYIKYSEPDLYNEGNMEIVSGQWIYVRCTCNSATSDAPSKASFEASYFAGTGNVISYSPDEEYKRFIDDVSMYPMPEELHYYPADVTGDGVEDRCISFVWGSGMVRVVCAVYDMQNHAGYELNHYFCDYSIKGVEDGRLIVEKSEHDQDAKKITGTVKVVDGELVFVAE